MKGGGTLNLEILRQLLLEFCEGECKGCYGEPEEDGTIGCVYEEFIKYIELKVS